MRFIKSLILLLVMLAAAAPLAAQEMTSRELLVFLRQKNLGIPVEWSQDDLALTLDDKPVPGTVTIEMATEPLRVIVLVDTSDSSQPVLGEIIWHLPSALRRNLREEDRVAIVGVNSRSIVATDFVNDEKRFEEAIRLIPAGLASQIYKGLSGLGQKLLPVKNTHTVFLVLSSGIDMKNKNPAKEAGEALAAQGIPVFSFCLRRSQSIPSGCGKLNQLSQLSGGKLYYVENGQDLKKGLNEFGLFRDMRFRVKVTAPTPAPLGELKIKTTRKHSEVLYPQLWRNR